jgi:hypothetical protein
MCCVVLCCVVLCCVVLCCVVLCVAGKLQASWMAPMIPTTRTFIVFGVWHTFQFLTAVLVPGNPNPGYGQATPAGHTLKV